MHRGAPWGHDSSVTNYRKQESFDWQVIDFPTSDLQILPRKYKFATELAEVVIVGPSEGPVPMPESASITASATPCPSSYTYCISSFDPDYIP
jgi:hypothetical protein